MEEIVIVLLGILLIIAVAVIVPSSKKGRRKCPQCAEWVKSEALKCRFCGFDLRAVIASSRNEAASRPGARR